MQSRDHHDHPGTRCEVTLLDANFKDGEHLGPTNVVRDADRQDVWIVAGQVVGGPEDGQIAAWGVSADVLNNEENGSGVVLPVNVAASSTNKLGDQVPATAPVMDFVNDGAVSQAIAGVPSSS